MFGIDVLLGKDFLVGGEEGLERRIAKDVCAAAYLVEELDIWTVP